MSRLVGQPARDLSLEEPALMLRTAMLRKAWLLGAVGAARGAPLTAHCVQGGDHPAGPAACHLQGPGKQHPVWGSWSKIIGGG